LLQIRQKALASGLVDLVQTAQKTFKTVKDIQVLSTNILETLIKDYY
jgi:hypothetical protein